MSFTGYAFDIYPAATPNGTRLVRLLPSQAVQLAFRLPEQGFSMADGQIVIHSAHADATAANFAKHNLVKVVDISTGTKVGSFFLEQGDFKALSTDEAGGRLLKFSGPNSVYYLERAILREQPFSQNPAAGSVRGSHEVDGMWAWRDADLSGINVGPGPIMVRGLEEGFYQPGPSGTATDAPLAHATWDFSRTVDSTGAAWQPQANEWELSWGTSILDLLILMLRAGLHFRSGADLDYHAYAADPAVDRTSATFASGKVRFAAGQNIVTEVSRSIDGSIERSAVLVTGAENASEYVTGGVSGVTWIGHVDAHVTTDPLTLQSIGGNNLDDREVQVESAFPLQHIVADDQLNGGYVPFIHYKAGDLVTLHTGTAAHHFNNFAIPVAAVRIAHDAAGNWFGYPELGAQALSAQSKAFEDRVNRIIHQPGGHSHPPNPQLCRPGTVADPPTVVATGNAGGISTPGSLAIEVGSATNRALFMAIKIGDVNTSADADAVSAVWRPNGGGSSVGEQAMTRIGQTGAGTTTRIQLYRLAAPTASTGSGAIVMTLTNVGIWSAGAWYLSGVDQTTPEGTVATNTSTSSTSSLTITADATDMSINAAGYLNASSATAPTAVAGQTSDFARTDSHFGGHIGFGGGHGDSTPGWDFGSSQNWHAIGVAVNSSSSGSVNDGHADLVGTGTRAARCGHTHLVLRAAAPTANDDTDDGYHVTTAWLDTTTDKLYIAESVAAGAAVWTEVASGVTDHGALTGLADDDHTQYLTSARHDVLAHDLDDLATRWEPVGFPDGTILVLDDGEPVMAEVAI